MLHDRVAVSPMDHYRAALTKGQLAYQYSPVAGRAVFPPRLICPFSGTDELEWRVGVGRGTVYSVTSVASKTAPRHVVLVDLDEGYRILSEVEGAGPVAIGQTVQGRIKASDDGSGLLYPVFDLVPAP